MLAGGRGGPAGGAAKDTGAAAAADRAARRGGAAWIGSAVRLESMSDSYNRKISRAKEAIGEVFEDTAVTPAETLEAMEELAAEVESKIEALKAENDDL